ncbi:MAG: hypothetical protein H6648_07280 [Caldilineae bacterium]|nr:hypothetical protein [Chloroflexota bacterium]MCB9176947.1 hypothetical protein [Caldilineae bacterium]
MACTVRRVDYFYTTTTDRPGEAYKLLTMLEELGIYLLAFTAVPTGPDSTQLALFPDETHKLLHEATQAGLKLEGPHQALLVQGDDELGALVGIHSKLYQANVNVYAATGVTDGDGSFGYLLYIRPESMDAAVEALQL